jgi:hypothetical protein
MACETALSFLGTAGSLDAFDGAAAELYACLKSIDPAVHRPRERTESVSHISASSGVARVLCPRRTRDLRSGLARRPKRLGSLSPRADSPPPSTQLLRRIGSRREAQLPGLHRLAF